MVKLTEEMIVTLSETRIFMVATASKAGVPNVVPVGMLFLQEDKETFWLVDNYMDKTIRNLKENPKLSFSALSQSGTPIQIKCDAEVETSGKDYEKAVGIAHAKKETYPAKSLIKLKVKEVYSVKPGDGAGKKLL
ncbi:MAG: pyridoxamine 5'-phosphate oxidase family protein [Candidatus Methanomethylophilaceae archaeon]|nr:pyridoxamine 5'-phosphate oxidase family protein [Candidatus Methanomethylophilaceae archaeon]